MTGSRILAGIAALAGLAACGAPVAVSPPCFIAPDQALALQERVVTRTAGTIITGGSRTGGCVISTLSHDFTRDSGNDVAGRIEEADGVARLTLTGVDLTGPEYDGSPPVAAIKTRITLTADFTLPLVDGAESVTAGLVIRHRNGAAPPVEETAAQVQVSLTAIDRAAGTVTGSYSGVFADYGYGRYSGSFTAPVSFAP